ncbi:MAG: hypothetical protein EOM50_00835 [Erysipelotrichia bacterium]|nr:hypothetical protein [Erysipelotrichia bacterium]NCC55472.1 hypothetical protein [Erysipelotrichia bacterium]
MAFFISFFALIVSIYALYQINEMKKDKKEEKVKGENKEKQIRESFIALKGHNCEIIVSKTMPFIDVMYSYEGIILDVDDEWVVICNTKGKKQIEKIIRICCIKDVKQLNA